MSRIDNVKEFEEASNAYEAARARVIELAARSLLFELELECVHLPGRTKKAVALLDKFVRSPSF